MTTPTLQAYDYHVRAKPEASADITVLASSREDADAQVRGQLNLQASRLTGDLCQSASEQLRKEMGADAFTVTLTGQRPPTEDDVS